MTKVADRKDDDAGAADDTGTDDTTHEEEDGDDDDETDELVDEIVARVLALLDGTGARSGGDDPDGGGGDDGGRPRSQADVESAAARAVRDAMAQLRKEEATDSRLKKIERRVEQAIREEAPRTVRRVTKLMWGDDK